MLKYSWSFDGDAERWYEGADTIAECIVEANAGIASGEYEPAEKVYIGENAGFVPTVSADSVLDQIEEDAYEFAGEAGEDWGTYNYAKDKAILSELDETLSRDVQAWLKKYGREPNFWNVRNIKAYSLKDPDAQGTEPLSAEEMKKVAFRDGICPECGGFTHGNTIEPMHCEKCGWVGQDDV